MGSEYHYDTQRYDPPAPIMRVVIRNPGDRSRQAVVNAVLDTGADITCLPPALIRAIGGVPAGTRELYVISDTYVGTFNSYFLEFEVSTTIKLVEVVAFGDELILGRNLLNEFVIELDGPAKKVRITSSNL